MDDMAAVDRAFYELTVKQRDAAWLEIERLKAQLVVVEAALAQRADAEELVARSIRAVSIDKRVKYVTDQVDALMQSSGFASVTVLTPVDLPSMLIAFRTPECSERCKEPTKCSVAIFGAAAEFLADTAAQIESGTAQVGLHKMKKDLPQ